MFERFTDRSRRVLVLAQDEARRLDHDFIGTEHLLLGILAEGQGVAARALGALDVTLEAARDRVRASVAATGRAAQGSPPFTPRAKQALELALREALQLGHGYIGTEHLLLGLVDEREGVGAQVLIDLGAPLGDVRRVVIQATSGAPAARSGRPSGPRVAARRAALSPLDAGPGRPDVVTAEEIVAALREITARLGRIERHLEIERGDDEDF